jgi:hypothetical protein
MTNLNEFFDELRMMGLVDELSGVSVVFERDRKDEVNERLGEYDAALVIDEIFVNDWDYDEPTEMIDGYIKFPTE